VRLGRDSLDKIVRVANFTAGLIEVAMGHGIAILHRMKPALAATRTRTVSSMDIRTVGVSLAAMVCWIVCVTMLPCRLQAQAVIKHPPGSYVEVNGAKMCVESEGQGESLILIPGGPGDPHSVFHLFFSRLADRYRVIYFDPFGVGKSDRAKSKTEYTFSRDVENLEGLRKALGLARMNVLGQSYGGMVAQAYALKYPASVARLILVDSFYSGKMWQANNDASNYEIRNQYPEAWEKLQQLRAQGLRSSDPAFEKIYDSVPLDLFYFHDGSKAALLPGDESNLDVYYGIAGDDADFVIGGTIAPLDFTADLQKLKMPMLVIAGRYDRVSPPRYALEYKTYAPRARFVMMEKSGHFPYLEEPDKTLAVLRDFLRAPVKNVSAK
jgi:proline iminopeptidase